MTTYPYFPAIPNPPNDPGDDVANMQTNSASISGLISEDHVPFNAIGGGFHEQVTFYANNPPGSFPVIPPVIFTNIVDGVGNSLPGSVPQSFFYSGIQANSATQCQVASQGSMVMFGGIILKWGSFGITGTASAPITYASPFPNNFYGLTFIGRSSTPKTDDFPMFEATPSVDLKVGFTAYRVGTAGGPVTYYYFAIGN